MKTLILALALFSTQAHALTLVNRVPEQDALAAAFYLNQDGHNLPRVIVTTESQATVNVEPAYTAQLRATIQGKEMLSNDVLFKSGGMLVPYLIQQDDFTMFNLHHYIYAPGFLLTRRATSSSSSRRPFPPPIRTPPSS